VIRPTSDINASRIYEISLTQVKSYFKVRISAQKFEDQCVYRVFSEIST
jgi:hypothetical protein